MILVDVDEWPLYASDMDALDKSIANRFVQMAIGTLIFGRNREVNRAI